MSHVEPDMLAAIQDIAEHSSVRHASIVIRVRSDRDVSELYDQFGEPVGDKDVRRPYVEFSTDGATWETRAETRVAGVSVLITGPIHVGRRVA